jgi:hypothetical protein
MTHDERDELILRHLDGDTTVEEVTRVTRLLAEDAAFRSRFFTYIHQVARLREMLAAPAARRPSPEEGIMASAPAAHAIQATPPPARPSPEEPARTIDFRQIYFNAVLGGIGGLLGWLIVALLDTVVGLQRLNIFVQDALRGPLFGICIGFAIGSTEGIIASRSLWRAFRGGGYGAALGALGGLIGLPLGEAIFNMAGGGVWPRAIGWAVFGAFIGTSDGFAQKMPAKIRYGVLGGLLGGLIGGSTFDGLVQLGAGRPAITAWSSAIGLIILGACIGALVGLVESLLRTAYVFFLTGRLEGQTRTLDSSRPHTLGSDVSCTIVIPDDPTVAGVHAEICFANEQFTIRPRDGMVVVRRDGRDVPIGVPVVLQPGDRVHLGGTRMIFRNEAGKKRPARKIPTP